ncbi:MAG: hypothetical protein ACI4VT_01285 [Bacilli bacterium]
MAKEVIVTADKISKWQKFGKIIKISLLILLLFLIIIYLVLKVTYHGGSFVVNLKPNESIDSGLAMYESLYDRVGKRTLKADNLQFMDNISIKWLPSNINDAGEGSHNGDNYIAYTFYIENQGKDVLNYWYKMVIDDIVKNVDEAARIMIFINGESTVYAKGSSRDGTPEKDTEKFRDDKDGTIILKQRANLYPGEIDKITVVVWIEGDDPECIDALIGGELKMHMDITEEHHQA